MRGSFVDGLRKLRTRRLAAGVALGLAMAPGCSEPVPEAPKPPPTYAGVVLKVGAVGDAGVLAGVAAQRGEWTASRKGQVEIATQAALAAEQAGDLDVLIFSGQEMGSLVDVDALEIIPNDVVLPPRPEVDDEKTQRSEPDDEVATGEYRYTDIAPAFRDEAGKYGGERYALPLGGSALVLVYRKDAFASEGMKEAARREGVALEPPTRWEVLDALARFFEGKDWDGDGKPGHGLAAALGKDAEGTAEAIFLARAASLGQHRDQYSFLFNADDLKPRLESPPFVAAMEAIAAWKSVGPPGVEGFDAPAARAAFRAGEAAMLIDRAERAADWSSGKQVSVAPLPGSGRVFEPLRKIWEEGGAVNRPTYLPRGGGWLVGVRRGLDAEKRAAAFDLALYLTEAEVANRILAERDFPMLSVRASQMGRGIPDPSAARNVDARSWSSAVSRTLMAERVTPGLRIPDAAGYLDDLAAGRLAALSGTPAEEALRLVAAAWESRSARLGTARQLWHYRRSLNTLATLPEPPPRGR